MAAIRRKIIKGQEYYYLEHRYQVKGKLKSINKYLGTEVPKNKDQLLEEVELQALREQFSNSLKSIQKNYASEFRSLPKAAKDKLLDHFIIEFIFNSNKIEGSKLSYKDTANLFNHNIAPKNKPLHDVKEAEGYREAFHSMQTTKSLTLRAILDWHRMIFKDTDKLIAGKIRLHRIMVTGSSASFPYPEDVPTLMKDFMHWYKANKSKYSPVEFAGLVHLKFVSIHPFSDGNGRISRLLMNQVLFHTGYPLFTIKHAERMDYYNALETSQTWHRVKDFVRFFIKRYILYNKQYSTKMISSKNNLK